MNKKYLPSALILYLNYFIHGVGCSILGQAVIKEALAASWGVQVMAITAISAALGLGRLIALPFAGPLSDKLGRRISTAIGSGSYAIYLIGLALAFNAGTHGGYQIAYICAIIGGIANSFLDTGIYPAVSEIIYKAPGVATMGIKFFIAIAQMLLPFVLGMTVATTAAGLTSYNTLFFGCGIIYIVLLVLVMIFPLPDSDAKAEGKKEGLIASLKHTHFSVESIAMIIIGFTCTGTFQLWLNCAQNFAKENVGWADPSVMQSYYSAGTMIALIVTALLTRKIKDVRFILVYPVICLATMVVVLVGQTKPGYNLQIGTGNQFITDFALFPNPTDTLTLIPFLQSFSSRYDRLAHTVVADSGYGSEENYRFMSENGMEAYVKYNYFHMEQRPRFKPDPFKAENFYYNEEQDFCICPMGQKMQRIGTRHVKTASGYVSENARYRAIRCEGCPLRCRCFKAKGNRTIELNHRLRKYKQKAKELLCSEEGLKHRGQRCIEPEAVFGQMKNNMNYKRFRHFGKDKVFMDFAFFAIAFNIKKMCAKMTKEGMDWLIRPFYELTVVLFRC